MTENSSTLADEIDRTDEPDSADTNTPDGGTDPKRQLMILGGLAVLLVLFGGLYLVWARSRVNEDLADRNERAQLAIDEFEAAQAPSSDEAPVPTAVVDRVVPTGGPTLASGEVLVVNRVPGDDYGRLAIRHTDGTRTLLDRSCMRVHIAGDHGVCLSETDDIPVSFDTTFFEASNLDVDIKGYPSALPSRARMSPTGRFSAVTAFVTGASYVDIGTETTTIVTIDEIDSNRLLRGANQFDIASDEDRFQTFDAQYWGITFAPDEDEVYVTGFYGEQPEIMRGTLNDMTLAPTGWIGSCPSLSPDGKTLVFKEARQDGTFELVAVDVESNTKMKLGEERSVDDQVEWLDNDTILYAVHPEGGDNPVQPEFDIWMLDIAPGSEPVLFLPNADSPAVAR